MIKGEWGIVKRGIVSVFGASIASPDSPPYREAYQLGRLLAQAGYTVMNGGYGGTMEASSKGAKEAGGRTIGVTVSLFERSGYRAGPNPYLDEVIQYPTLSERLHHLVTRCDAAVALRGGIGTLSEMALMWSFLQVGEIPRRPLILLGQDWADLIEKLCGDGSYVRPSDRALIRVAAAPEEVITLLERWE